MSTSQYAAKRGELRIYLGAAPGVGKTYAMLGEAHRRLERGTDLVAAIVETHGRKKTADLIEGIEMVPPKYIEYRGKFDPPDGYAPTGGLYVGARPNHFNVVNYHQMAVINVADDATTVTCDLPVNADGSPLKPAEKTEAGR